MLATLVKQSQDNFAARGDVFDLKVFGFLCVYYSFHDCVWILMNSNKDNSKNYCIILMKNF